MVLEGRGTKIQSSPNAPKSLPIKSAPGLLHIDFIKKIVQITFLEKNELKGSCCLRLERGCLNLWVLKRRTTKLQGIPGTYFDLLIGGALLGAGPTFMISFISDGSLGRRLFQTDLV